MAQFPTHSQIFNDQKNIMRVTNPELDEKELNKRAASATQVFQSLYSHGTSLDDVNRKLDALCARMLSPEDLAEMETSLMLAENTKRAMQAQTVKNNLPENISHEMEQQIYVNAIQKAQAMQKQTCRTCSTPDRLIDTERGPEHLLKRCTACKEVIYCSVQCQRRDWPRHKVECLNK